MPSSLVFAALALAWIVVLVPMVARRRQEVRRTADSALAARVLRRGDAVRDPVRDTGARVRPAKEVPNMPNHDDELVDGGHPDASRRYRPGRGGFDPQAAELAARARYAFRQRVVLFLLLAALASGLFAGFALPLVWWAHAGIDLLLVSYLGYLRRQVRIEQEIRQRRLDRAARPRRAIEPRRTAPPSGEQTPDGASEAELAEPPGPAEPPRRLPQRPAIPPGTAVVDLDDEDPALCDLDSEPVTPYRRAVGE
jgi:hypothetical protein